MYYVNFDQHITFKFGVVLENWPVQKFQAPGNFSSIPIISLIYSAFESGAARFRSLSDEEWQVWRQEFLAGKSVPAVTTTESIVEQASLAPNSERSEATPASNLDAAPTVNIDAAPAVNPDATPATDPDVAAPASSHVPAMGQSMSTEPAPSHGTTPTSRDPSIPSAVSTPTADSTNVRGEKRTIDQVDNDGSATDVFVNNFGGSDGLVQVTKRPRKKRSDAGVKRGPRKKPAASNAAPATA